LLAVPVQPLLSVTVTVYVVVGTGLTEILWLVVPLDHEYPLYVRTVVSVLKLPLQIVSVPVIEGVGKVFTVIVALEVDVHPLASVTVTI
jgi:hypothetical protein